MKKFIISCLLLFYLVLFGTPIYGLPTNKDCGVLLNGECVTPDVPLMTVKGDVLIPLRWFAATMGASSISWDDESRTVTVVVDDFLKAREYLSYLSGLESAESDYPLPDRLQNLVLPDYPLYSKNPTMINPSPIGLTIISGDLTMPWAVYDYKFKNNVLYVGIDWLNILFLAQIEEMPTGLSITYPTTDVLDRDIASLSALTMPTSAEEALALWIHGQQHRNGSLQYSALSPELKEIALANLHKQGWVTGGSSPSLEEATIQSSSTLDESTFVYEVNFKERNGAYVGSQIHQMITIEKYIIDQKAYWFISDVIGDLDYYTVL